MSSNLKKKKKNDSDIFGDILVSLRCSRYSKYRRADG